MQNQHRRLTQGLEEHVLSRRGLLADAFGGLAGVALAGLVASDLPAEAAGPGLAPPKPRFPARAQRVLQIFCPGGASHMDLWEHKPALTKLHGQPLPGETGVSSFQGKNGPLLASPWPFHPAGESGKMLSSLLPEMAAHVDDIAFVHSMQSKTNTHGPGCVFMNTGTIFEGFPAAGAWVSHALGSANENLPTYVAIPDIRGNRPMDRPTGAMASCLPNTKPSSSPRINRSETFPGRRRSRPKKTARRATSYNS